ncbi:hypothetical protein [Hankyongella ginsenosidimutans]|uniref:hypothetical protein n=1 Tax=Hankyongella ginsenosidimutans TaxID=1763828 RepID=UPI001CA30CE9|nr:hypothetical protein [Hankyongella ginsenosidimutans]
MSRTSDAYARHLAEISPEEYRALIRQDLRTFVERAYAELNPATHLLWNWHLDAILDRLEACRRGDIRRLIINVPPRSLKSLCASIAFPAFLLGHQPSAQIICASYGQDPLTSWRATPVPLCSRFGIRPASARCSRPPDRRRRRSPPGNGVFGWQHRWAVC